MMNRTISVCALLGCSALLAACGGGGGSDSDSTLSGRFLDGAVQGLTYSTNTLTGTTDRNGTFQYRSGEVVSFELGNLPLGGFVGRDVITPRDISGSLSIEDTRTVNMLRLLQTLDSDDNPDNGITLPPSVANFPGTVDLQNVSSIQSALNSIGGGTLIPEQDAIDHFLDTLSGLPAPQLAESYTFTVGSTYSFAPCIGSDITGATLSVSPNGNGFDYIGSITRANTGVENFSFTGTSRGTGDGGSTISVDADEFAAEISVSGVPCTGRAYMTTNPAINLPPVASRISLITQGICQSAGLNYDVSWEMRAFDRDGWIAKRPTFIYTIDGQQEVQLIVGDGWSGRRVSVTAPVGVNNIPCTAGFTWEFIAEDNEGETISVSGSFEGQFEPGSGSGGGGSGDGQFCVDDYPLLACQELPDSSYVEGGTCASSFPNATDGGPLGCTADGFFDNCGACSFGGSAAARGGADATEAAFDALYRSMTP